MNVIACWCFFFVALTGLHESAQADITTASSVAAQKYSAGRGGLSLLVWQDDHIVYEAYSNGFGPDRVTSIFSGTKGFWRAAAVAGEQDGILDLDEPVKNTITEGQRHQEKANIRILELRHLKPGIEPVFAFLGKAISSGKCYS